MSPLQVGIQAPARPRYCVCGNGRFQFGNSSPFPVAAGVHSGMRDIRQGNCPLCGHHEIVHALPIDFGAGGIPHAVAYDMSPWTGLRGTFGALNVFVCRACGFAQWFAHEPEKIPIGKEHGTRLLSGRKPEGPFR